MKGKEDRWLMIWAGQTKSEKIVSLILLGLAILFLIIFFTEYGSYMGFEEFIQVTMVVLFLFFLQKMELFRLLHRFHKQKKLFWLSWETQFTYYAIYIMLFIFIRRNLFLIEPIPYFRIFFPITLGIITLFAGIKVIKDEKIRIVSRIYKDKSVKYVGIILIIVSIYIMFFFKG